MLTILFCTVPRVVEYAARSLVVGPAAAAQYLVAVPQSFYGSLVLLLFLHCMASCDCNNLDTNFSGYSDLGLNLCFYAPQFFFSSLIPPSSSPPPRFVCCSSICLNEWSILPSATGEILVKFSFLLFSEGQQTTKQREGKTLRGSSLTEKLRQRLAHRAAVKQETIDDNCVLVQWSSQNQRRTRNRTQELRLGSR